MASSSAHEFLELLLEAREVFSQAGYGAVLEAEPTIEEEEFMQIFIEGEIDCSYYCTMYRVNWAFTGVSFDIIPAGKMHPSYGRVQRDVPLWIRKCVSYVDVDRWLVRYHENWDPYVKVWRPCKAEGSWSNL